MFSYIWQIYKVAAIESVTLVYGLCSMVRGGHMSGMFSRIVGSVFPPEEGYGIRRHFKELILLQLWSNSDKQGPTNYQL
jgi:hypothetical protein